MPTPRKPPPRTTTRGAPLRAPRRPRAGDDPGAAGADRPRFTLWKGGEKAQALAVLERFLSCIRPRPPTTMRSTCRARQFNDTSAARQLAVRPSPNATSSLARRLPVVHALAEHSRSRLRRGCALADAYIVNTLPALGPRRALLLPRGAYLAARTVRNRRSSTSTVAGDRGGALHHGAELRPLGLPTLRMTPTAC